jgi:hypothetical protein
MQAGQVYGVPLSGALLAKPGLYPEQKNCGEDFRKKWIEASTCCCLCCLHSLTYLFVSLLGSQVGFKPQHSVLLRNKQDDKASDAWYSESI